MGARRRGRRGGSLALSAAMLRLQVCGLRAAVLRSTLLQLLLLVCTWQEGKKPCANASVAAASSRRIAYTTVKYKSHS
jgi:hypothetical protein